MAQNTTKFIINFLNAIARREITYYMVKKIKRVVDLMSSRAAVSFPSDDSSLEKEIEQSNLLSDTSLVHDDMKKKLIKYCQARLRRIFGNELLLKTDVRFFCQLLVITIGIRSQDADHWLESK